MLRVGILGAARIAPRAIIREWLDGGFREHTVAGGTTFDFELNSVVDAIYEKAGFRAR